MLNPSVTSLKGTEDRNNPGAGGRMKRDIIQHNTIKLPSACTKFIFTLALYPLQVAELRSLSHSGGANEENTNDPVRTVAGFGYGQHSCAGKPTPAGAFFKTATSDARETRSKGLG